MSIRHLVFLFLMPAAFAFSQTRMPDAQEILQRGLQSYNERDYAAALEAWRQGLELAQQAGDELFAGSFHGNLGIVYTAMRDYPKAAEHLEKSLEIARSLGDQQGLKNRLNNLGGLYLMMNEPGKALERFTEALEVARTLGDQDLEAKVLNNIGESYLRKDDPEAAVEHLQQALKVLDGEVRGDIRVKVLSNFGLAHASMGNYPQALNHYRLAINYSQKGEDGPQKSAALIQNYNRMGLLLKDMGDPLAAIALHQSAVAQSEAAGSFEEKSVSERLLGEARAQVDGDPATLHRLRVEGLQRMLARLRQHNLDAIAEQVEDQIARLEEAGSPSTPSAHN